MADRRENPFGVCASCGSTLFHGREYPVSTKLDDDGNLELYSFCDDECQSTWKGTEESAEGSAERSDGDANTDS